MINLDKLKHLVRKEGKIEAQCPACAAEGADTTGNHLVIYPDGRFGCVANPGEKSHNQLILKLVGDRAMPSPQITVRRQIIPETQILLKIGRLGGQKPNPPPQSN